MRTLLLIVGVAALAMGLLWIGQGLGYIRWPASSFMIGDQTWSARGSILAVGGLLLILAGRRRRR
jgi:uncharacterized membrane protein